MYKVIIIDGENKSMFFCSCYFEAVDRYTELSQCHDCIVSIIGKDGKVIKAQHIK